MGVEILVVQAASVREGGAMDRAPPPALLWEGGGAAWWPAISTTATPLPTLPVPPPTSVLAARAVHAGTVLV